MNTFKRRFIIPEVVQTSAMDCGPAALASLLSGAGAPVSYARLREACQTQVDGTSIDVLEVVANQLGLVAEQTLVPVDHMLARGVETLPAIVVMRASNGLTHFVVAWRRHGDFIQVMDPAVGRRFVRTDRFLADLYRHRIDLPADQAEGWVCGDEFAVALTAQLDALRIAAAPMLARARATVDVAGAPDALRGLATLDAAVRTVAQLVATDALRKGTEAEAALTALFDRALVDPTTLSASSYAIACKPVADANAPRTVAIEGAVCLRAVGRAAPAARGDDDTAPAGQSPLSSELRAATDHRQRPWHALLDIARTAGARAPLLLGVGLVVAVLGAAVEALLLRGLFDLGKDLGALPQRIGAVGLVLAWALVLTALDLSLRLEVRRLGRLVEGAVRVAFLEKIPQLADRYLSSRPASDMAQRAHALHRLRAIPELAADVARTSAGLVVTAAGLVWLDPAGLTLVLLAVAAVIAVPVLCMPVLTEQDLRLRVHGGALFQFLLDALLGLVAVRAHGAERALRREHEALLVEWLRAARGVLRTGVVVTVLQGLLALAVVAALVTSYLGRAGEAGGVLLFVYWALQLPALGQELAQLLRQAPQLRNVTLRMLEPLGPAGVVDSRTASPVVAGARPLGDGCHVVLDGVTVHAGGHTVLDDIRLDLPAGAHVAVVGPSGAGKSSLVGLLLGWHVPSGGKVLVDGRELDVEALRTRTAWLNPAVQLWSRSLLDNLRYGDTSGAGAIDRVLDDAELSPLLSRLPDGLNTHVGEGGGLLSGGEGQRVRFGRALMREAPALVILDEPFRGLDRDRRRALLAKARERFAGATLICVTHDIEETQGFDRVVVVDGGRVVEDGAPAQLATQGGVYNTLLDAERALTRELWGDPAWTHLRLGAPSEAPARVVKRVAA